MGMKKITQAALIVLLAVITKAVVAQVLTNNGASLTIATGATLQVNGASQYNTGSTLTNNGAIAVTGSITNNMAMSAANNGTLTFNGTAAQTLIGTAPYMAKNVTVNNAAGVTIGNPLRVDGTLTFTNGIITAANTANAVIFTANGTGSVANNASHVEGYVVKEGTGSFTYPVGDGARYQPILLDLTANNSGMLVRYLNADAGAASYTTTGASATALEAYNSQEYWDISPFGTATGKVTLFYDDYKNASITSSSNVNVFKVAHKTSGGWLNEGGIVSGTINAGSVTSAVLSSWSPFTLGAISESALPVTLASFNVTKQENAALLVWSTTSEVNSEKFDIQRSVDGKNWLVMGSVSAVNIGDAFHSYSFKDNSPLAGRNLYRLKMIDLDASFAYSRILGVEFGQSTTMITYPNPSKGITTVQLGKNNIGGQIRLISATGLVLQRINVASESVSVGLGSYAAGVYFLQAPDGKTVKVLKE